MLSYHVRLAIFLNGAYEKADSQKTKVDASKITKVHADFVLGKNGGHRPSSLGRRSIVVVSESDENSRSFRKF